MDSTGGKAKKGAAGRKGGGPTKKPVSRSVKAGLIAHDLWFVHCSSNCPIALKIWELSNCLRNLGSSLFKESS